jgi:hypothetical protein
VPPAGGGRLAIWSKVCIMDDSPNGTVDSSVSWGFVAAISHLISRLWGVTPTGPSTFAIFGIGCPAGQDSLGPAQVSGGVTGSAENLRLRADLALGKIHWVGGGWPTATQDHNGSAVEGRKSTVPHKSDTAGVLACWRAGVPSCWRAGVLACWRAVVLACWRAGVPSCRRAVVPSCRRAGVLACRASSQIPRPARRGRRPQDQAQLPGGDAGRSALYPVFGHRSTAAITGRAADFARPWRVKARIGA